MLGYFGIRIIRKISGPIREAAGWSIRSSSEIERIIRGCATKR